MQSLVVANWKSNGNLADAEVYGEIIHHGSSDLNYHLVICPPNHLLTHLSDKLSQHTNISIGAQNLSSEDEGAYTGEVAATQLKGLIKFAIIGHSERRRLFHEDNKIIAAKVKQALKNNIKPIICVEEEKHATGHLRSLYVEQALAAVRGLGDSEIAHVNFAWEPIWAIGTGNNATAEQAAEAASFIREALYERFGAIAKKTRILYGGSVNTQNASEFLENEEIGGVLVGKASLNAKTVLQIAKG